MNDIISTAVGAGATFGGSPAGASPWLWPRAAYVHIPFCAHHCGYCDFAVATRKDQFIENYLDALTAELTTLGEPRPVQSVFIGGGTPTYLSAKQLDRLLHDVTHRLALSADYEFTVEANPGTLDADKVEVLADHGVNRVSLGAQSFHPHLLRVLERDHQPDDVPRAVDIIRQRIAVVSLDLIFGVPGQTLEEWDADLDAAVALEPDHVSTYGLTYETGTRMWKQRKSGDVKALDEDTELALYRHALDKLEAAGFEHYEISNHARPGRRCRHNQVYWANHAYFGFGMGAARYVQGRRELNTRDLHGYIKKALSGETTTIQSEVLGPEERARETIALQLRRAEGIHRRAFQEQTGFELDALAGATLARHAELGLIIDDSESVRLARQGKFVADALIRDLL